MGQYVGMKELPTDNLYKFIAISGIILIVAVFFFGYQKIMLLNEYVSKIEVYMSTFEVLERTKSSEIEMQTFLPVFQDYKRDSSRLHYELSFVENYSKVLIGLLFLGFILQALGFCLWFVKVQRYEDIILKNKAIKSSN